MNSKQCTNCKRTLPLSHFHSAGYTAKGKKRYHARCDVCTNTILRERKGAPIPRSAPLPSFEDDLEAWADENLAPFLKAAKVPKKPKEAISHSDPDILRVLSFAKKSIPFSDLCDRMDMSPKKVRALLDKATSQHAPLHVEHDTISVAPSPAVDIVQEIYIPPPVEGTYTVGAISDTHLGSKYCLRGAIRETVQWLYDQGVRDIVHSGDVVEGCYNHARYELSHVGFDAQVRDAAKCFPKLDGLRYHFITGNHDYTFEEKIGMRVGIAIQNAMQALERDDWIAYGDRSAYVELGGAVFNLWHPRGSATYAKSYVLQKRIEGYTAIKPQILLMGHYHQFCYVYERGVHGIAMPSFQGSGSNFAQSLRGPPSIGGLLLQWQLSETGRIHNFRLHPRFFFEKETIFNPRNPLDAIEIQPAGRDHRYARNG